MGAYIYMVRSPKQNVRVNVLGQVREAARLCYLYKPWGIHFGEPDRNAPYNAVAARMEKSWAGKTVSFVVVCDKDKGPKPGDAVRSWKPGWITVVDDPDYGGTAYIGTLTEKVDGVWQVKPYEPTLGQLDLAYNQGVGAVRQRPYSAPRNPFDEELQPALHEKWEAGAISAGICDIYTNGVLDAQYQ